MSDSVRPHRWQPTRLPHPWDSPGKNTEVGCHFLLQRMKMKRESEVAQSCATLMTPWTEAYQAPPSMGFIYFLENKKLEERCLKNKMFSKFIKGRMLTKDNKTFS